MKKLYFHFLFLTCFLFVFLVDLAGEKSFPSIYKVICLKKVQGCPCYKNKSSKKEGYRLYHAQGIILEKRKLDKKARRYPIKTRKGKACWFAKKSLEKASYSKILHSPYQKIKHNLISLSKLIEHKEKKISKPKAIGRYWPTYYHLALEDFHPGAKVPVYDINHKVLTHASKNFLTQVKWQGSGISKTGLRLNLVKKKPMRFRTYPKNFWGWGAGYDFAVYPYRTVAVNFRGLCQKLLAKRKCKKKDVIGALLYIPRIAQAKIPMPNQKNTKIIHDGYFCANDTGSPYYIRADRMDIFVGTHRGGNPYLPKARQKNLFIQKGIENLVPSDWRLWKSKEKRIWCPLSKLPKNIYKPKSKDCTHDYHVVARKNLFLFMPSTKKILLC